MSSLPSWLAPLWSAQIARIAEWPHGILLAGPPGIGKRLFAEALAARLLCAEAQGGDEACGACPSCRLRLSANHPDLLRLEPPTDADSDNEPAERKGPAASGQIRIEQVRELQSALTISSHQGGRRVVIIDPAEAMNPFTANAMLKLLEEPPDATHLLLVSANPRRLLPTLRSRCQSWTVARPEPGVARQWLERSSHAEAVALLALAGGAPLMAVRLAEQGAADLQARFVADLMRLPDRADALEIAARWEAWGKAKDAATTGMGLPRLADWMQRWVWDLAALAAGVLPRYFPDHHAAMRGQAERIGVRALLDCYNEISQVRRSAAHPLNLRLAIEDMLLRYARTLSGGSR